MKAASLAHYLTPADRPNIAPAPQSRPDDPDDKNEDKAIFADNFRQPLAQGLRLRIHYSPPLVEDHSS